MRAILRRAGSSSADASGTVEIGALSVDPARHEVRHQGELIAMTAMEFKVLHYLAARAGTVVSRDDILHAVVESDAAVLDRTIDVHVAALRRKLKDAGNMIETVRGVGIAAASLLIPSSAAAQPSMTDAFRKVNTATMGNPRRHCQMPQESA